MVLMQHSVGKIELYFFMKNGTKLSELFSSVSVFPMCRLSRIAHEIEPTMLCYSKLPDHNTHLRLECHGCRSQFSLFSSIPFPVYASFL